MPNRPGGAVAALASLPDIRAIADLPEAATLIGDVSPQAEPLLLPTRLGGTGRRLPLRRPRGQINLLTPAAERSSPTWGEFAGARSAKLSS